RSIFEDEGDSMNPAIQEVLRQRAQEIAEARKEQKDLVEALNKAQASGNSQLHEFLLGELRSMRERLEAMEEQKLELERQRLQYEQQERQMERETYARIHERSEASNLEQTSLFSRTVGDLVDKIQTT